MESLFGTTSNVIVHWNPDQLICDSRTVTMWSYIGGFFVLVSLLFLPLVLAVSRRRRILKPIPGLEETFILGHTLHFMNKSPSVILETLNRGFRENGRVWKALLFHDTVLLVSDPKIIEVSENFPVTSSYLKINFQCGRFKPKSNQIVITSSSYLILQRII